jgi:hypothetical protein
MAGDGVTADPAALDLAGQQFDVVAQALDQVNQTLSGTLDGLGNFWGNDELGQAFSGKYVGPAQTWLDQTSVATGDGLPGIASTTQSWARTYQNAADNEQSAAQTFQSQLDG